MDLKAALEHLLDAYRQYYNINRETPPAPFAAEARFSLRDEQYFLFREARISHTDSSERVYFALAERLDEDALLAFDEAAWALGTRDVRPAWNQKGADVVLILLTNELTAAAEARIPKIRRSKSYALSLKGWTNYRLIAMDLTRGRMASNRLGKSLVPVLRNRFLTKG